MHAEGHIHGGDIQMMKQPKKKKYRNGENIHGGDIHTKRTYTEGTCMRRESAHEGSYTRRDIHAEGYTRMIIHQEEHTQRGHIYGREFT